MSVGNPVDPLATHAQEFRYFFGSTSVWRMRRIVLLSIVNINAEPPQ